MPTNLGITEGVLVLLVLDRVISIVRAVRNGRGSDESDGNGNKAISHLKLYERQEETNRMLSSVALTMRDTADSIKNLVDLFRSSVVRVEVRK